MNINAVNTKIPTNVLNDIKKRINEARTLMPFLVSANKKQRQFNYKMGSKRFDFVTQTVEACKGDSSIVPLWVSLDALQNDYLISNQLLGIENMLEGLLNDVRDTRMQAGTEALKSSIDIYNYLHRAKDRVPGLSAVFNQLKSSFPGRGKSIKKKNNEVEA